MAGVEPHEEQGPQKAPGTPLEVVRVGLRDLDVQHEERTQGRIAVTMPGERKLRTECMLEVGPRAVDLHAFVARCPEENHAQVSRFLLERNLRMRGLAFAVDHAGDIHLTGSLPIALFRDTNEAAAQLDTILGQVLAASDETFNRILELGFAGSIRREWAWRTARGESTRNLEAFRHLRPT